MWFGFVWCGGFGFWVCGMWYALVGWFVDVTLILLRVVHNYGVVRRGYEKRILFEVYSRSMHTVLVVLVLVLVIVIVAVVVVVVNCTIVR